MKALSDQALALANDSTKTATARKGGLDRIEPRIHALAEELKDELYLAAQRDRFGDSGTTADLRAGSADEGRGFTAKAVGGIGAPPLALSRDQVKGLFDAVRNRQFKSVELKVSSVESPMSAEPQFIRPVFPIQREHHRVLDLIPIEPTTSPTVWYYRGTTGATAAAPVAEGATKPQSSPVWTRFSLDAHKIAHWAEVTDETIADFDQFLNVISDEMLAGLINTENDQLLNGTGVSPAQQGILTATGIQTRAKGTETSLETLFLAGQDLRTGTSFVEPDGIVMHPNTYGIVRLTKDTQGRYLAGDPMTGGPTSLWGIPVVTTTQIAAGSALVANFAAGTRVWLREGPRLEVNPLAETSWKANKTLVRCEERMAGVGVVRPTAVVKVTGLV